MKTKLLVAALAATAFTATSAQAAVSVSGHVNAIAILSSDNFDDIEVRDNTTSASRFRFKTSTEAGALKIGATYEFGVEAIRSLNGDTNAFDTRVAEGYVAGSFGKVTIGKGSVATDGTFESYAILGHYLAGPGSRLAVAEAIGTTYADIDGGRSGRIRYDSPSFNGLKFAVSVNNGGSTGVMAGYDGKIAGGALRVRAGSNSDADYTAVSVAYKHSSGLGVAYSDSEKGAATSDWLGLSYAMGNVVLSAGTGETAAGAEFTSVGLNYKPAKGVEIYLNNASAGGTDDGSATYLGTRVKF